MPSWTSETLKDVYARLLERDVEFVVIGGQAVNLWSEHYSKTSDLPRSEWQHFEPFSSGDLDCLGDSMDARAAGDALGVEAEFYPPFSRIPVPNSGSLVVPLDHGNLLIHFIHTPYGANPDEVRRTALALSIGEQKPLLVMHPVLCLETKITCLFGLDQRSRQDLKHVHLSCLIFHEFVRDRLQKGVVKDALLAAERVGRLACAQNGLNLWHKHSIACESFLPINIIRQAANTEPKFASFVSLRWPIIETKIRDRRSRFLSIVEASQRISELPSDANQPAGD
jgi:hypothetical protein